MKSNFFFDNMGEVVYVTENFPYVNNVNVSNNIG